MTVTVLTIANGQHYGDKSNEHHAHSESQPKFTLSIRLSDSGEDNITIQGTDLYALQTPIIGTLLPRASNVTFN